MRDAKPDAMTTGKKLPFSMNFFLATTLLALGLLWIPNAVAQDDPPSATQSTAQNIVLILVDDLGWMDLGCQGSQSYETPHIDRIAKEGMRFTDGYASCAVCSPTRASVQTGRYPGRLFVTDWIRSRFQGGKIPEDRVNPSAYWTDGNKSRMSVPKNALWMESEEVTLAELLDDKRSCYIGKWHLGADDWYPEKQGYDLNIGGCDYGQPPSYFDPYNQAKHRHQMIRDGIPGIPGRKAGEYLTDREGEEAEGFINDNKDQPFFLMYAPYAVHTPIQARRDLTDKYTEKIKGIETNQKNAKYAAMMESLDNAVGRILGALDKHGLEQSTMVIFTSDNGGLDNKGSPTENAPLRSGKGYAYEGGVRVPLLIKWPGVTKPGSVTDVPATSVDLFPTIAAATGTSVAHAIDGVDLRPALEGKASVGRESIFWHFPHYRHNPGPYSMIRQGNWKLIKWWAGPEYDLYNLRDDLGETRNLADDLPIKREELDAELMAHLGSIGAKIPKSGQ